MKIKQFSIFLAVLFLLSFAGCKAIPVSAGSDSIIGTWKDSYGLTQYQFDQDGKMKIEALNLGSFKGTYQIENDKITIQYRVVVKDVTDTYTLKLDGTTMYLDDKAFTRKR